MYITIYHIYVHAYLIKTEGYMRKLITFVFVPYNVTVCILQGTPHSHPSRNIRHGVKEKKLKAVRPPATGPAGVPQGTKSTAHKF